MKPRFSPPIRLSCPAHSTFIVAHEAKKCAIFLRSRLGVVQTLNTFELDAAGREALMTALLDWRYLPAMPDDDTTVLVAADGEVVEGYHSDHGWFHSHTGGTDRVEIVGVYAWAQVPVAPPPREPEPTVRTVPVMGGAS